ncbi:MAG: PAS domain S-box protein [Calditrichaeota bacterium]|nr:PAS domain S-box protein [Calditrichota bacterium]
MVAALTRKLIDFLGSQFSTPKRATAIMSQISRFKELPPTYQEKELPSLYLKIEQYLVDEDPLQKFTRSQLRKTVRYRYEPLMDLENFRVIFEAESTQEVILAQFLLQNLMQRATNVVSGEDHDLVNEVADWLDNIPEVQDRPMPFGIASPLPETTSDWIPILVKVSRKLYRHLEKTIGPEEVASLFEKSYREIAETYRPLDSFYAVVQLLPDNLLDENKIGLLSGEQIRNVFLNKVEHLRKTNEELSRKNIELNEAQNDLIIAQDTAMESVKLFHGVLDTVEEGIVTADADGKIILVNEQVKSIFGYDEDEMLGETVEMLMPEKYREQHRKGMERFLRTNESHAMGQRLFMEGIRKSQQIFPLELQITQTRINDRVFFTAAIRDRSEDVKNESQMKKTADNLRLVEQKYKNLVESMSDIIFTLNLDGEFASLNTAFEKLTHLKRDEWLGKPFTQIVHQDDSMKALKLFQQVLQGEAPPAEELRFKIADDRHMIGDFSIVPQMQNGKLIGALGIARDVTHQRESEKMLRNSEQNNRRLLDNCPEAIGVHINGKLIFVNKTALSLLGASELKQVMNYNLFDLLDEEHREEARQRARDLSGETGSNPLLSRVRLKGLDGQIRDLEMVEVPVQFQNYQAVQFVLRESRAEAATTGAEEKTPLRELFLHTQDAVLITDPGGRPVEMNPRTSELFKVDKKAIVGKKITEWVARDVRERVSNSLLNLAQGKLSVFETEIIQPDGTHVPVEVRGHRINFGGKIAMLLMLRNISDRRDLEEERQKLSDELRFEKLKANDSSSSQSDLQKKLTAIQAELQDSQMKYRGVKVTLTDTEEKLKTVLAEVNQLRGNHQASSDQVSVLRQNLEKAESEKREATIRLQEMQLHADTLDKKYQAAVASGSDVHALEASKKELETVNQELRLTVREQDAAIRESQLKIKELEISLQKSRTGVQEVELNLQSAEMDRDAFSRKLDTLNGELRELEGRLAEAEAEKQQLAEKLAVTEAQVSEQIESIENRTAEQLKAVEVQMASVQEQSQTLRSRLSEVQEERDTAMEELTTARQTLAQVNERMSALESKLEEGGRNLEEAEKQGKEDQARILALQEKLITTEKNFQSTRSELMNLQEDEQEVRKQLSEREQELAALSQTVGEKSVALEEMISQLEEASEKTRRQVAELRENSESQLSERNEVIAMLEEKVTMLNQEQEAGRDREEELSRQLEEAHQKIQVGENAQARVETLEIQLEELTRKLDESRQKLLERQSDVEEALHKQQQTQSELFELRKRMREMENGEGLAQAAPNPETEAELNELRHKLTVTQGQLAAARRQQGAADKRVEELEEMLASGAPAPAGDLGEQSAEMEALRRELEAIRSSSEQTEEKMRKLASLIPISPTDSSIRDDYEFWQHLEQHARDPFVLEMLSRSSNGEDHSHSRNGTAHD